MYDSTWDWGYRNRYGYHQNCGTLNLTESSSGQGLIEPLSVDQVQNYLRIVPSSPSDPLEESDLQLFITGAREQAEILQGRDLVQKQWDLTFDYWPGYQIELRGPLNSVDLFQYKNSVGVVTPMTENVDYIVDPNKQPGVVMPPYNGSWPTFTPWPSSSILLRFTSGYSSDSAFWNDAGARIKNGMLLLISSWYNQRLPFETGADPAKEYPYAVTACLSYGGRRNVR
jgi:uncharacterized phiE125 gp8 family phage protein